MPVENKITQMVLCISIVQIAGLSLIPEMKRKTMSDNKTYLNIICPVCGGSAVKTKTHSIDRIYIYCGACGFQYNSAQKEKRDPKKVYIVWAKGDIADLRPDWTEKKC